MLTHDNMYACMPGILMEAPEMVEGTRTLVAMPLYHIGGCGWALAAMYAGSTLVVVREIVPDRLLRTIVDERIASGFLVPAVLLFLSQLPGVESADLSRLQRIFYGASPITPELLTRCIELFRCRFTQVYGLTETTGAVAALRHEEHAGERLLSCGRANLGSDIRVVDAEGRGLPVGEVGELVVRGRQVMRGYHGRPGDTAEVIRDGWLHSGDAAALDADGYIYIRDRIKDMIVTGGENVYPIEVESVIAEHPSVDFVATIPRNPTGKILKRELRDPYWHGQQRSVAGSGVE